jgi:hypothetical protein
LETEYVTLPPRPADLALLNDLGLTAAAADPAADIGLKDDLRAIGLFRELREVLNEVLGGVFSGEEDDLKRLCDFFAAAAAAAAEALASAARA